MTGSVPSSSRSFDPKSPPPSPSDSGQVRWSPPPLFSAINAPRHAPPSYPRRFVARVLRWSCSSPPGARVSPPRRIRVLWPGGAVLGTSGSATGAPRAPVWCLLNGEVSPGLHCLTMPPWLHLGVGKLLPPSLSLFCFSPLAFVPCSVMLRM